ncbi:endoplasmic reticulum lectin 1 isoform X2 [Chironomus tepperi]|uniref:endoplasmic reticulum lectin 1 isoform X2 n=1 Tax=Chironomus tepperi TaxID=113505 RepID=UPI00391FA2AE
MKKYHIIGYVLALVISCSQQVLSNDFKGFDDNILFSLNFPGDNFVLTNEEESTVVTTHANEKYHCHLPKLASKNDELEKTTLETSVLDYLEPLFKGDVCSYRIESYWTYEICHGNYIKQYHEERDGKTTKLQEYYLGKWNKQMTEELRKKLEANKDEKLKYKKIDGLNLPYFEVEMIDGTLCDLNNEPRITRVLYVCYAHGKNEIYSLKETSTCNYEIIVLTPTLCLHPKYKIQETTENAINCLPLDNSPKKPKSLLGMEVESMKLRYQKLMDGKLTMELVEDVSSKQIEDIFGKIESGEKTKKPYPQFSSTPEDTSIVESFLSGKTCLTGGTGWWKYEFCYGKYVKQYHVDKFGGKTTIMLGTFDETMHQDFLNIHPEKRPKAKTQRKQITHFYSKGSVCDKTGKFRQVEVILKCLENSQSASQVSLYLLEPTVCNYVLGVESPLICKIIDKVGNDGLMPKNDESTDSSEETIIEGIVIDDENNIHFQNN